jgi:bifunctional DNA primase/polymerase-like protein
VVAPDVVSWGSVRDHATHPARRPAIAGTLRDAALAAAGRGWHVFPLRPGTKRPRGILVDWEARATTDPDRIGRWWSAHPVDNVAVACGPSGLVVVDLDVAKAGDTPPADHTDAGGGWDVFDELARRHAVAGRAGCADGVSQEKRPARRAGIPPSPVGCETFTVATPSGGQHRYYRAPAGRELRNTAGRIGWRIDTRAAGGYVVAPGSIVDQTPYVVACDRPAAELPAWVVHALTPPMSASAPGSVAPAWPAVTSARRYVDAAVDGELRRVIAAGPGARNHALNKAAWNLGRFVAAGKLDRAAVEDLLQQAGEAAGYQDGPAAVQAVIRAALDRRLRHGRPSVERA